MHVFAVSFHVHIYMYIYFRSANMPTTSIHRVTRTARVSNDTTFTRPDKTYDLAACIDALVTNRCIGRFGNRHASGPSVDSRNLFLDRWVEVFRFFFLFFFNLLMNHASRPRFELLALITPALRTGLTRDGTLIRTIFAIFVTILAVYQRTKERLRSWPMTIIVCQITRSISR